MAKLVPFEKLEPRIRDESLDILKKNGFKTATPVQASCYPLLVGHKDVAVEACTGSGKTLAFVLPVTEILGRCSVKLTKHQVGAIIITPTRELAQQVYTVACPYLESVCEAAPMLLVGGSDPSQDAQTFKEVGANVLIGTPGRLHDIMERSKVMQLRLLEVLILDEADRLLGMGFERQLTAIINKLPKQRRTGLFSATQTEAVAELARAGLRNAVRITVNQQANGSASGKKKSKKEGSGAGDENESEGPGNKTPSSLRLQYLVCGADEKLMHLVNFMQQHQHQKVIIYFLTCAYVDFITVLLPQLPGYPKGQSLFSLHGKMKQSVRESTLSKFSSIPCSASGGKGGLPRGAALLCTDLAARGLDIPDVDWVLQFDPPQDPQAFVHRVGRTARMGRAGAALVFLTHNEEPYVHFLNRRQVPLELAEDAGTPTVTVDSLSAKARTLAETDRDVMEKGTRAFVSCVRAYKEHHCTFIFRLQELELGRLAQGLGLLQIPKMSETKKSKQAALAHFTPSTVDPNTVKFKDKNREKQRVRNLQVRAQQQQDEEEEEAKRKQKERQDRQGDMNNKQNKKTAQKRRQDQDTQDFEELDQEYRLLKKLKKGEITERQFEEATGLIDEAHEDVQALSRKKKKRKG